jgi:hypothetical protein
MNIKEIKWHRCEKGASNKSILEAEEELQIKLPRLYCNLMSACDAGIPIKTDFEYYDVSHHCRISQEMGTFLGMEDEEYNIVDSFKNPPEFFPKSLLAFGETGNGDYICFDYRTGKDNPDPPIAYWNHEADIGRDVSFVANNFEEFLGMLKMPEDEQLI